MKTFRFALAGVMLIATAALAVPASAQTHASQPYVRGAHVQASSQVSASLQLPPANKFVDGFEAGNKAGRDSSGINVDGFKWVDGSGTPFSVVRADGCVVWNASNKAADNCGFANRRWGNAPEGIAGKHAARGNYPARSAGFAEQRFDFGTVYDDVWIRFWFRVPVNYKHGNVRGSSTNNKFFAIWQDGYSQAGQGSTVVWEYWPNPDGSSRLSFHYSPGNLTAAGGHQQHVAFMGPADSGRWMQVVLRVKTESAPGAGDGVIQSWRRWDGFLQFTKVHDATAVPLKAAGGWRRGYFLGASNSWWAAQTEFLIDNVEVSTTPLVPAAN